MAAKTTANDVARLARVRQRCRTGEARTILDRGDVTAAEAARAVGVSHVTMGRWLAGTRRPSGAPARRFDELLDMVERISSGGHAA